MKNTFKITIGAVFLALVGCGDFDQEAHDAQEAENKAAREERIALDASGYAEYLGPALAIAQDCPRYNLKSSAGQSAAVAMRHRYAANQTLNPQLAMRRVDSALRRAIYEASNDYRREISSTEALCRQGDTEFQKGSSIGNRLLLAN